MTNLLNQFNIPNFSHYTLSKDNNNDTTIKKFFINNNHIIVEKYIEVLPKPNNIIKFDELKTLYLLDKDLRTCIYIVLEEIETALKSFIKMYVDKYNINLSDKTIYIRKHYENPKYKFQFTLDKLKKDDFTILDLYFSDVSKIISLLKNKQQFIQDIHAYFMPHYTLHKFKKFISVLWLLRNIIAHHESCIKFFIQRNDYNMKSILTNLYVILNNIRDDNNQSSWLDRVNNHINDKLENYTSIKMKIGY